MKTLLLKLVAGSSAILALQFPVGHAFRKPVSPSLERVRQVIEPRPEVFLLSDSVLGFRQENDGDSLGDRIVSGLPGVRVGAWDGAGYTPELHSAVLEYALRQGYRPAAVVVSVNLRSFSELWDLRPQYQYSEMRARIKVGDFLIQGLQRPLSSYGIYAALEGVPRGEREFHELELERDGRRLGRMDRILASQDRKTLFSALYLYALDPGHRKVRALRAIAERCRSERIPLRIYVTPIDVDAGEREWGEGFRARIARNVAVLRDSLATQGAVLEDWSGLLRSEHFSYGAFPNEHLNGAGRELLARDVLRLIRSTRGP